MSTTIPRHTLAGLRCPRCHYDLRGATSFHCSECGCPVDATAQRMVPPEREPLPGVGAIATLFTLCSCSLVAWLATTYAVGFVKHGWFGSSSARDMYFGYLLVLVPMLFTLPLLGTWLAHWSRVGFRASRCCVIVLFIYWIACLWLI